MNTAAFVDRVETEWQAFLLRQARTAAPHPYVYASAYRACERRMVYELTEPEKMPPWSAEMLAKFRRGDDRERDLLQDLTRIGRDCDPPFKVIGQQERFVLKDHKSRPAIVGKVDAVIEFDGHRFPLESKAWSPMLTDRIGVFEDVFDNPFTYGGGLQMLAYLYGAGAASGLLLLDRSGLPRLLEVDLERNLDRIEAFLVRAERVLDHVEAGTLPDYLGDAAECRRCPFFMTACNPPLTADLTKVLTDPELEQALERREVLKAAASEFESLDRDIKRKLRGVESALAGAFQITGRWGRQSRVELPDDLKKQFTVVDPHGRFTLEITRL